MCGKLGCAGGNITPVVLSKNDFITTLETGECKSVEATLESDDTVKGDITYVYEGTKCGDRKVTFEY